MIDLTKWPLLIVRGESITEAQANEVLIRTNSWHSGTNDREFQRAVLTMAGMEVEDYGYPKWDSLQAFCERHGVLDLSYLSNSRIYSAWIGGPHGWCDWTGTIGCANYNIGKWPSVEEVTEDWTKIAEAFPFLQLVAQLVPNEGEAEEAAVTFMVAHGKVVVEEGPAEPIAPAQDLDAEAFVLSFATGLGERGVSLDRLEAALAQVRGEAS